MATTKDDITAAGGFYNEVPFGNKGTIHVFEFDHVAQMAEFDYSGRVNREDFDGTSSWQYGNYGEGFNKYDGAASAIREGRSPEQIMDLYRTMRESIDQEIEEMISMMPTAKRKRKFGLDGAEIDIERYMLQNPEAWVRRERGQKKKTIRIFINYGYSAGTGDKSFAEGAVRGVALADVLTRLGHGVEIVASSFTTGADGKRIAINAMLKASDTPVDPQSLLVTCLPALSRVFEFGILDFFEEGYVAGAHVAQVTQAHVDAFGIDVFASGTDFKYMGSDEDHISEVVGKINAMMMSTVSPEAEAEMNALFAALAPAEGVAQDGGGELPAMGAGEMECDGNDDAPQGLDADDEEPEMGDGCIDDDPEQDESEELGFSEMDFLDPRDLFGVFGDPCVEGNYETTEDK
jgi:hypothetical protein